MRTATTPKNESQPARKIELSSRDRQVLDSTFSIDSRALAILRILMAALVLVDSLFFQWSRPRDPEGLIQYLNEYGDMIVIPFALMMLVGFKTRYAVILCWLAFSLRIRADLLDTDAAVSVGDYILNLALFWSMFLPLGRHLSIDSRGSLQQPVRFLSIASGAFLFQIFIIYFSAGVTKEMGEWVVDATALQTILANPTYETALGVTLVQYPTLLAITSVVTIALEIVGSLLAIVPGKSLEVRRLVLVPLFIAFHIGIAATMGLGLFPYVLMAVWLIFLPARFWDRVWGRPSKGTSTSELTYDRNKWRTSIAAAGIAFVLMSNVITWLYYPNLDGFAGGVQSVGRYLVLYQQWAMFSVPSSLP